MTNNHVVCLECGVSGIKRDLVKCVNCRAYSIHRYCMIEWPATKTGSVSWFCGCQQQHDEISNEQRTQTDDDDGDEDEEEEEDIISKSIHQNQVSLNKKKNTDSTNSSSGTNPNKLPATKFMRSFTSHGSFYGPGKHAEPILCSIWSGSFQIRFMMQDKVRLLHGITAFLSNKVDEKAWDKTVEFGPVINAEMVVKDLVWPNGFEETGPKDEDIAVYFFSSLGVELQVYDCLVFEMIRDDLAMRLDLENAQVFIFTSVDLIPRLRKFQGKRYLWGFFRQKHRSNDEHDSLSGPDLCSSC